MVTVLDCGATVADPGDPAGASISRPRQIEFSGLLMGAGTPYRWKNLTGWDSQPVLDSSDASRDTADGDYPGPGWLQARMVALEVQVHAETTAWMEDCVRLLRERLRWAQEETPLVVRDSGRVAWALARVVAREIPHTPPRTVGVLDGVAVQWKCTNPAQYSTAPRSVLLVPSPGSGGEAYPTVYPVDYGTPGGVGERVVLNAGTDPATPVVVFRGPTPGGYAVGIGGRWLRMDLPLAAEDRLRVDTRDGSVVLNGTADRTTWVAATSQPPDAWVIPDGETVASYAAPVGAGAGAGVELTWYDTYK